MIFRAVGLRCAVDLTDQGFWPYQPEKIQAHLLKLGFLPLSESVEEIAQQFVGQAVYRRGARMCEAPAVFDCSSFTKWVYGRRGIWLPRRSIQQSLVGQPVEFGEWLPGDLLFTGVARRSYFSEQQPKGIGHVAIVVDHDTVIHAMNPRRGITQSPIRGLIESPGFRSIRQVIPAPSCTVTYVAPLEWEIESSDDVRWVVLSTIARLES